MRKSQRWQYAQEIYDDPPDLASSPEDGFAFASLTITQQHHHDDIDDEFDDGQAQSTDHLFEVLRDMFPMTPLGELRRIWHRYRPNLEAAVCHVLAQQSDNPAPTSDPFGTAVMDEDLLLYQEWPLPGSQSEREARSFGWQEHSTYRDRLVGTQHQQDFPTEHDDWSEASMDDVAFVSPSNHQFPVANHCPNSMPF